MYHINYENWGGHFVRWLDNWTSKVSGRPGMGARFVGVLNWPDNKRTGTACILISSTFLYFIALENPFVSLLLTLSRDSFEWTSWYVFRTLVCVCVCVCYRSTYDRIRPTLLMHNTLADLLTRNMSNNILMFVLTN